MEKVIERPVTIEHADLLEICRAAEAWASTLRNRAQANISGEARATYLWSADRIVNLITDTRQAALDQRAKGYS